MHKRCSKRELLIIKTRGITENTDLSSSWLAATAFEKVSEVFIVLLHFHISDNQKALSKR